MAKNLNVNLAVFPKSDLIYAGSFNPGNSTNILSPPCAIIVGSLVPSSSIPVSYTHLTLPTKRIV